jgi:hypothetical protein
VIAETETAILEWEVGKKKGKGREQRVCVGDMLQKQVVGVLKNGNKRGRPRVKDQRGGDVCVKKDVGCQQVRNRRERAKLEKSCN